MKLGGLNIIFTLIFWVLVFNVPISCANSYYLSSHLNFNLSYEIESFHLKRKPVVNNASESTFIKPEVQSRNWPGKYQYLLLDNWGVMLLIFIPIVALALIFYRFKLKHLKDIQKVKKTISADLHDEIGSHLTNIHLISFIAKKDVSNSTIIKEHLSQIEKEVRKSSEALDEIVWNLKIPNSNLEGLVTNMRRYCSKIFDQEKISYAFNIKNEFAEKEMCLQKRRELYLVFKELINNFRKHAKASSCLIEITERNNMFYMLFKDNGVGFNPKKKTNRNGLKNMKYRLKKWGGKIKISSSPGSGSLSEIWLPFENKIYRLFKKRIF